MSTKSVSANSFEEWDNQCDVPNSDKQKLYNDMKTRWKSAETADVLYRMSKICMILSKEAQKVNNKELEKSMASEALCFADKACKKEPNNSECHKWYCAAVGKLATLSATKEKINYGKDFKDHADIALKLNPNDQLMQSMYGQWCYNVASLSWIERKVAQTVYGKVPEATYEMALMAFKKVHELDPESKENHLWLAKTLIALSQPKEAIKSIKKGLTLQNKNINDEIAHKELEELNKKYK